MSFRARKQSSNQQKDNRINFLVAIIFIIGLATIAKLYDLQILRHEHYEVLAARQQQGRSTLEPRRGRIFIQDSQEWDARAELFPLATNKQFATLYARPNTIKDPAAVAEKLFAALDQPKIESEVTAMLARDPEFASSSEDFRQVKRELEVRQRKDKIMAEYLGLLSKSDDPYAPLAKHLEQEAADQIKEQGIEGIDYSLEEGRFYPERNAGAHLLGFVGYVGDRKQGRYGLEGFFDHELSGKAATIEVEKSGTGEALIGGQAGLAQDGSDLVLTINRSIQFETCRLLAAAVKRHGADGGSVVILEPKTGAVIAMCAYPDYDPNDYRSTVNIEVFNNPVIFDQFEPGSTFKAITMAAALDEGKVGPNTTYTDKGFLMIEGWPKPIKNSDYATKGGHGLTNMTTVLQESLNTGSIFAMEAIGAPSFVDHIKRFGFGEKTGIELETESPGNISNLTGRKIRPINAATASFGQGITATPIQMAVAYAAIANGGLLMKPFLVKAVVPTQGEQQLTEPKVVRRVISERASSLLSGMLVNAVENGHASRAQVPGYYVAGKTGTAQVASKTAKGYEEGKTIQTFIGYAPASQPRFVMLTRLDDPKDSKFAESSAVPLFGEIASFVLNYYQVPQERKPANVK